MVLWLRLFVGRVQPPGQGAPACCLGTTRHGNCKLMTKEDKTNKSNVLLSFWLTLLKLSNYNPRFKLGAKHQNVSFRLFLYLHGQPQPIMLHEFFMSSFPSSITAFSLDLLPGSCNLNVPPPNHLRLASLASSPETPTRPCPSGELLPDQCPSWSLPKRTLTSQCLQAPVSSSACHCSHCCSLPTFRSPSTCSHHR